MGLPIVGPPVHGTTDLGQEVRGDILEGDFWASCTDQLEYRIPDYLELCGKKCETSGHSLVIISYHSCIVSQEITWT